MVTVRFHASLQSGSLFRNEPPIIPLIAEHGTVPNRPCERATAEAHRTAHSRRSSGVGDNSSAHGRPDRQVTEQIYGNERGISLSVQTCEGYRRRIKQKLTDTHLVRERDRAVSLRA
ncbi:hypothetical protein CRENBAI_018091 [Crenichthys baileyi]|uniref:Uncharacterized protein n=1 Tax=Crenichthys baileyi TaxID=28760 RepID=A0AAV9RJ20_9TELE